jgi:prophage regulatory protein
MKLIKLPEVLGLTAKSRSTHYGEIHDGVMTPPVKIGGEKSQSVAWPEHEIKAINAARIAGKSDADIRSLVTRLVDERQGAEGGAK